MLRKRSDMYEKMLVNSSTLLVLVCLWETGLCAETKSRLFSKGGSYATAGSRPIYTATVDSEMLCAVQCYSDEQCATFEYNKDTKLCRMSTGLLSGAKYGPHVGNGVCPPQYEVFVREKNVLCLKHYSVGATQTWAINKCSSDGASLVLIENESMFNFVVDIKMNRTWGELWINGHDDDDDGNNLTLEGHPLPYVPPGSDFNDANDEKCVRLTNVHVFYDSSCLWSYQVLCEIVV